MPYYPEWRIYPGYNRKLILREERNGVTILRSWMWVPREVSSAKRVVFEASFLASSLLRAIGSCKPDLLLVVSPPLGLGLSAVILNRWWKIPYMFDVQDLQPDAAAGFQNAPQTRAAQSHRLEAMAYRNASLISTVTEGMRQRIVEKGISAIESSWQPPPADNSLFDVGNVVEGHEFRCKYNLKNKFTRSLIQEIWE